jgi:metal-responsive CopG/Arc/MetJ family transcriptional regulator
MPRCGRIRNFIKEYKESPRTEKISFIPPFLILTIEAVLIVHAIILNEIFVIILTAILLVISTIEIVIVSYEIHEHYIKINFDKKLTIRLDDFITEKKEKNVKKIVTDFINQYSEYDKHRNEIYHTTCQILETHKEEEIEKELTLKIRKFISKNKITTVDDIVDSFIKKFPKYRKFRGEIYIISAHILTDKSKK